MKFNKIEKDNLECTLEIIIEPSDYIPEYKKQINDVKSKGSFKGFRKGKTPDSFVSKMYGKSIVSDAVSKEIDKAFTQIVKDEKIRYVAQPLPSSDQMLDIDHKDLNKSYSYSLDLGLIAPIEVKGVGMGDVFTRYEVSTDDKEIEDHLANISKNFGVMEPVTDKIQGDDVLKVSATELDGAKAKKDGWMASFDIVMKSVGSEELKTDLLKKKKGDKFTAEIKQVTNRPENSIRKDLLGVDEDDTRVIGDNFSFVIEEVQRLKPAELTDELIKEKLSTWNLESVEELKEDFRKNRVLSYKKDADSMIYRDIMDSIMKHTEVNISETFLKRWLTETEKVEADKLEETVNSFSDEIKWVKIKEQLMDQYKVAIAQDDIDKKLYERAKTMLMQYGMTDESLVPTVMDRLRQDQNEFYNIVSSVESEKLFSKMIPDLTIETIKEGSEKFYGIIDKKFNTKPVETEEKLV